MSDSAELSREELSTLLDIAGDLATQIDQDRLVHTILEKACGMTGSPDGSVLLYDPVHLLPHQHYAARLERTAVERGDNAP